MKSKDLVGKVIDLNQVLTSKEASEIYGVTERQITRLCINEKLTARKTDKVWLIDKDSLEKYFNKKSE